MRYEVQVREWCRGHGFALRISNKGHHWQLTKDKFVGEWWPSSAKLVINKQWPRGYHCHDYRQALQIIERVYVEKHNSFSGNSQSGL